MQSVTRSIKAGWTFTDGSTSPCRGMYGQKLGIITDFQVFVIYIKPILHGQSRSFMEVHMLDNFFLHRGR
jgi:hypothetical protein